MVHQLERRLDERRKLPSTGRMNVRPNSRQFLVAALAVLVAGILGMGGWSFIASQSNGERAVSGENVTAPAVATEALKADVAASLTGPTFDTLRQEFPETFQELVSDLADQSAVGIDPIAIRMFATERLDSFRAEYAHRILTAPDDAVQPIIIDYLDTMQLVLTRRGEDACRDYLGQGTSAFGDDPFASFLAGMADAQTARVLSAIARSSPLPAESASEAEWAAFRTQLMSEPAGDDALRVLGNVQMSGSDICPAMATYLQALLAYNGTAAPQLRREMAFGLAAN